MPSQPIGAGVELRRRDIEHHCGIGLAFRDLKGDYRRDGVAHDRLRHAIAIDDRDPDLDTLLAAGIDRRLGDAVGGLQRHGGM